LHYKIEIMSEQKLQRALKTKRIPKYKNKIWEAVRSKYPELPMDQVIYSVMMGPSIEKRGIPRLRFYNLISNRSSITLDELHIIAETLEMDVHELI